MQKFKLGTVFIAFVALALALLTLVSTLINVNQFSNLYYGQTEQEYLPNSVGLTLRDPHIIKPSHRHFA